MNGGVLAAARLAWAHWLGDAEAVQAARAGGRLPGRIGTSVEDDLPRVAACLFAPPHEDTKPAGREVRQARLDERFGDLARANGLEPRPFWPDGQPYAVVFTHDVDRVRRTYQGGLNALRRGRVVRTLGALAADGFGLREENAYFNFAGLSAWEREKGFRSAWYFLNERRRWREVLRGQPQHAIGVYRLPDQTKTLRRLVAAGHEIGVHYNLDSSRDQGSIPEDCALLRSLSGVEPRGGRAHYLRFSRETLSGLQAAGLTYDASMAFNYANGFRCGTSFPFPLPTCEVPRLWELPTCLMDTALQAEEPTWTGRTALARELLATCRRLGGAFVVNWHQRFANPEAEPELWTLMADVVDRARADGAWFATPERLIGWWAEERIGGCHG